MRLDCRLFAVPKYEREELKVHPALVLGRSLLDGHGFCDLQDAGPAIRLILSDPDDHRVHLLMKAGEALDVPARTSPRLLSAREVRELNLALSALSDQELQRRFNHQKLVFTVLERISAESIGSPDLAGFEEESFPESEEAFVENWTLDDAEEFEQIAEQVEKLQSFIRQTARQGQGIVIVLRETK